MGGDATYRLGEWRVDPAANTLTKGTEEIRLEPKLMDVLQCLAGHAGEVVSKRELIDEVWHTEYIAENSLTRAIADLRRALGDDARHPSHIQTIPKRGYRLIAETGGGTQKEPAHRWSPVSYEPLAVIVGDRVRFGNRPGSERCVHALICGNQEIPLIGPTVVFGRGEQSDIQFLVSEVSRTHAKLDVAEGHAVIEDLGSKNGTKVNNQIIDGPHRLSSQGSVTSRPSETTEKQPPPAG
jgi:DNA-binding winged helix-turn-helix (wHTH) protein